MNEAFAALQDQSFARATSTIANSYPPERRLAGRQLAGYLDRRAFALIGLAVRRPPPRRDVRLRPARDRPSGRFGVIEPS